MNREDLLLTQEKICKDILVCNMGFGVKCDKDCGDYFIAQKVAEAQLDKVLNRPWLDKPKSEE